MCELTDGTPIPPDTARRLACTAGILPVVLDGNSRPLDLGTSQRYASPAQRLALMVRDRGCVFPGCDRPHWMCDAHHLLEHPAGPTDLENLALVCEAHHHLVHEGGWRLEPSDHGGWIARPLDLLRFMKHETWLGTPYSHYGEMSGTTSIYRRRSDGFGLAAASNANNDSTKAMNDMMNAIADEVTWPAVNHF